MKQKLWAYVVDIYEQSNGPEFPVVSHVFFGRTREQAMGYYKAHLKTDEFLRGCVKRSRWKGVDCWAEARWEQV